MTVFERTGKKIPRGTISKEVMKSKGELVEEARKQGFKEIRINAERVPTSSSANPGPRTIVIPIR